MCGEFSDSFSRHTLHMMNKMIRCVLTEFIFEETNIHLGELIPSFQPSLSTSSMTRNIRLTIYSAFETMLSSRSHTSLPSSIVFQIVNITSNFIMHFVGEQIPTCCQRVKPHHT